MDSNSLERFFSKVEKQEDGCWIWQAGKTSWGYGTFSLNSRSLPAHRASYEHFVGPIPKGLHVDHLCEVRACVNPAHLEPVTIKENVRRASKGHAAKTHCPRGHEYDEANTYLWRGNRVCRTCRYELGRERNNATTYGAGTFNAIKTHCPRGHEYTEENTYIQVKGHLTLRSCRTCRNGYRKRASSPRAGRAPQQPKPDTPQPTH